MNAGADTALRFAALKRAVDELIDLDETARESALHSMDAGLAQATRAWLRHVDAADLEPDRDAMPEAFGPFRVISRLGRGGMGEVFLAERHDAGFEQRVAIKRVPRGALSPDLERRFLRERRLLARLQHPGIARLLDGGIDDDGSPWLAMEYVPGETLLAHAARHALDVPARVRLLRGVCAAVAYAHRNLVIHRDIKPANVLVTPEGEPRLLDFGIAKLLDDTEADATHAGLRALTPRYAAPEQLAGERTTTATDVHALGVLLREMTEGALAPRLRELGHVVRRATAAAPADRYDSVAALDADLDDWLAARPLRSGIGGARAQTRYLLSRYRWPIGLAVAVVVASTAGAFLAWQQAQRARVQAARAESHLQALLDVLSSANPRDYATEDPRASEFLSGAARRLHARGATDPALARRALAEIGHALLNLGKPAEAEKVLAQALDAARRDPHATPDAQLGVLGLLVQAQDEPEALARLPVTAAALEDIARTAGFVPIVETDAPGDVGRAALASHDAGQAALARGARDGLDPARLADALARTGGALSRAGDDAGALKFFALANSAMASQPVTDAGISENLFRQRGWADLRAMRAKRARSRLATAVSIAQHLPAEFSPMRRAEGELLLSEAERLDGDFAAARASLERARPVYEAEYVPSHPERAAFDLVDAALLSAESRDAEAFAKLLAIDAMVAAQAPDAATEAATAAVLRARIEARAGRCAEARAWRATAQARHAALRVRHPREREDVKELESELAARCAPASG